MTTAATRFPVATWTHDSRYVLAPVWEGRAQRIWAFPAEGGDPKKLDLPMERFDGLAVSPDGRQLLFTGVERKAELWTIKNLLPDARTPR